MRREVLRFRESYVQQTHGLLKNEGLLTGVLFNFNAQRDSPPYPASKDEYISLFRPQFEIEKLEPATNSEPGRKGKELFFQFKKILK